MATKQRPRVGIVYSESSDGSNESKNLAHYLCGCLSTTGHATMVMVGLTPSGSPVGVLPSNRIQFIPCGKSKAVDVPASDVTFGHWSALEECHMVLVTVNATDTDVASSKLAEILQIRKHIVVFAMQRGVRSSGLLKDQLTTKCSAVVVECTVGFAVVQHPQTGAYVSTVASSGIVVERLSKDIVEAAEGPATLLETMPLDIVYRKVLTAHSWGVLIYENLYALNILTGGSLAYSVSRTDWRMLLAAMIRENYKTLDVAARGGKWKPDLTLISWFLTPWAVEMLLILPQPLFLLLRLFGITMPALSVPSPGLLDLAQGRRTMTSHHLNELVQAGKRHGCSVRACEAVLVQITQLETECKGRAGEVQSGKHMAALEQALGGKAGGSAAAGSMKELMYWLTRGLTAMAALLVLYFLFIHE